MFTNTLFRKVHDGVMFINAATGISEWSSNLSLFFCFHFHNSHNSHSSCRLTDKVGISQRSRNTELTAFKKIFHPKRKKGVTGR